MSAPLIADRNLLFGILALQMDFISRDALITAMNAWVLEKAKPLGRILQDQGVLSAEHRALLEPLVEAHIKQHGNDVEMNLASVSSIGSVRDELKQIADPDLHASLAHVSVAPLPDADPYATRGTVVGTPTSAGTRFRILRPHAGGGLGEVFVAEDEELHREVALKQIRERHADDPGSRSRFLVEAEITGRLEHPGIVPVYGLGQYSDGRPFYAMRFVRGDSLKEAIERFHKADVPGRDPGERTLELRKLLGRFLDVCDAVAYAHARGVLHRDLKPGNVMLGKYGETLVVDWGLAKPVGRPDGFPAADEKTLRPASASGSAPTQMGSAIGTPPDMSPEQAAGRLEDLGPATDVYSLGATLYNLLTGKAPFDDSDVGAILQKVEKGDFPPPREVKRAVPAALEAICLKGMALRPEDRYPSPRALADDIEHWLADEPVAAYREPWTDRLRRWGRRHRPLMTGAAGLLIAAVVALAVSTVLIREREQAARVARQQAEQQRDRADHNLRLARDAVDKTVTKITADARLKEADFHQLRHDLLECMLPFYNEFVKQQENDSELEAERGRAYGRLGMVRNEMGEKDQAVADYEQMRIIFARLATRSPDLPEYRQELARSHNRLGGLLTNLGKREAAEATFRDALKIQEQLVADFPQVLEYRQELAGSQMNLGNVLYEVGKQGDAEAAYREALKSAAQLLAEGPALADHRRTLAHIYENLAMLLYQMGKRGQAESALKEAVEIYEHLAADFPKMADYRQDLGRAQRSRGIVLHSLSKWEETEAAYLAALKVYEQLAVEFPKVPEYRQHLARTHNSSGVLLRDLGKPGRAVAAYGDALKIQAQLAAEFPETPQYRQDLATSNYNRGMGLRQLGKPMEAEAAYRDALNILTDLAAQFPTTHEYRQDLAKIQHNLGNILRVLGKRGEAEVAYCDALRIKKQMASDFPKVPQYRRDLANTHNCLGELLNEQGKHGDAEVAYRDSLKIREQLAADFPKVPDYHNDFAETLGNVAILASDRADFERARQFLQRAVPHHHAALKANSQNLDYRQNFRDNRRALIVTLASLGEHADAVATGEELARLGWDPATDYHAAASALSQCVSTVQKNAALAANERPKQMEAYADHALKLLRQAVGNGYKNVEHMKKDKDLEALRSREDFKKLLAELEAKAKPDDK